MPAVDTVEKLCTEAIDYQKFSSYTVCTFEWQTGVYPSSNIINQSINQSINQYEKIMLKTSMEV